MAFLRRPIDAVNTEIQFELNESCSSVNLKFNPEFTQSYIDALVIRVERISKNTANQVLYSGVYSDLKAVLAFAFPTIANILPFAVGKSVELSDEVKVLVTIQFSAESQTSRGLTVEKPTSFEYELNTTVQTTRNPLLIKKIVVDEEMTVDSEFYPLLLVDRAVKSFETVVIVQNELGVDIPKKVFYGHEFLNSSINISVMQSLIDNSDIFLTGGTPEQPENRILTDSQLRTLGRSVFVPMVTSQNQKITLKGNSTNYLILLQS